MVGGRLPVPRSGGGAVGIDSPAWPPTRHGRHATSLGADEAQPLRQLTTDEARRTLVRPEPQPCGPMTTPLGRGPKLIPGEAGPNRAVIGLLLHHVLGTPSVQQRTIGEGWSVGSPGQPSKPER